MMPFIRLAIVILMTTGCSTLFPELDPFAHTSVKKIKEASVEEKTDNLVFEPSLGIPAYADTKPWIAERNDYIGRGLSGKTSQTIWGQIQSLLTQVDNDDVHEVKGNLAEKLEASLNNVGSIPKYLEKSLISSHNGYTRFGSETTAIGDLFSEISQKDQEIRNLLESQLVDVQNLRETLAEIKILEARSKEIQAALPAKQINIFIDNLAKEANRLNKQLIRKDRKVTKIYAEEKLLRNELIHKENQLRVSRSDQLFFINDVADNLMSSLPALGSGWVQWATFMLNEEKSWNLRDDSLGWSMASLVEKDLKPEAAILSEKKKTIKFSGNEIKSAVSWYYSLYGEGLSSSPENCSIAEKIQSHKDGLICDFIPGRNSCKSSAIFSELQIVDDLRDNGFIIYLDGRDSTVPKVGVVLGVVDEDHYHVAEYDSMRTYFENELKIENKDYSNSKSKVLYIEKKCASLSPHELHKNLVERINNDKKGIILELSVRGQPIYVPVHQARIEQIPLLMKNGKYSRTNQSIDADFVDSISRSFLNPNTERLILTKATINIIPSGYLNKKPNDKNEFLNMTFMYLLELNTAGEVIDSTWYLPFPKKNLGFEHRWFHLMKPTGIYYPDEVNVSTLDEFSTLISKFRK